MGSVRRNHRSAPWFGVQGPSQPGPVHSPSLLCRTPCPAPPVPATRPAFLDLLHPLPRNRLLGLCLCCSPPPLFPLANSYSSVRVLLSDFLFFQDLNKYFEHSHCMPGTVLGPADTPASSAFMRGREILIAPSMSSSN